MKVNLVLECQLGDVVERKKKEKRIETPKEEEDFLARNNVTLDISLSNTLPVHFSYFFPISFLRFPFPFHFSQRDSYWLCLG